MGGSIGFTIREESGKEHRMCRWTNLTSCFINHSKFIEKDPQHLADYLKVWYDMVDDFNGPQKMKMSSVYVPNSGLAPDGYGLIVVDYKTNTVLHMQNYTNYGALLPAEIYLAMTSKFVTSDPNYSKNIIDDAKKLISTGKITKARAYSKKKGSHVIEINNFEQIVESNSKGFFSKNKLMITNLIIDMNPWIIKSFDKDKEGLGEFKKELLELGFLLTPEEEQIWSEEINNKDF
jgi:hypothetical protein